MDGQTETINQVVRLVEKDPQWTGDTYLVINQNSNHGHHMLQILHAGEVDSSGVQFHKETRFKLYQGATPDKRDPFVMFECIDGAGMGQMICVTEKGDLSSRSRKVDYHNFDQAESDVLFFQERVSAESSLMRFQWCKGGGYMGFEKSGKPMNLKDVHPDSDAAKFMLHPFK